MATNALIMGAPACEPVSPAACADPALSAIRAALVKLIDAACVEANASLAPELEGMPHKLFAACCYLASRGFDDEPCQGETWFRQSFADYREFAANIPSVIETGRRFIFDRRRPIGGQPAAVPAPAQPVPAVAAPLGAALDRMVAVQMAAYPDHWTNDEKREVATAHLFGRA